MGEVWSPEVGVFVGAAFSLMNARGFVDVEVVMPTLWVGVKNSSGRIFLTGFSPWASLETPAWLCWGCLTDHWSCCEV